MSKNKYVELSILRRCPILDTNASLEIRPLAPLSMVSEMPGSFYKTLLYPSKKMICGLFENMLGWHFDRKLRNEIFNDWKKVMKKKKIDVNVKDYQQGSTFIPLLMDYFELSGEPTFVDFKGLCNYTDLWSRCYRRSDSSDTHMNGCRNIDISLVSERNSGFENIDKEKWFKEHIGQIPCFYTTPTYREFVDIDAICKIPINIDGELMNMLQHAESEVCYLGNSEGWVQVRSNVK